MIIASSSLWRSCEGLALLLDRPSVCRIEPHGGLPTCLTTGVGRRTFVRSAIMINTVIAMARPAHAVSINSATTTATSNMEETGLSQQPNDAVLDVDLVPPTPDARKLFNEARAYESQGNLLAAQKLYDKITRIAPRFVYGWSNLGNTQTAFGDLTAAEESYTKAIRLCDDASSGPNNNNNNKSCPDYYLLLLNRGTLRINNGSPKLGLADLQASQRLRGRPDAVVLQNLARAEEINGLYNEADRDYTIAIQMTANEVVPFWLRSVLVKYQLGDIRGGFDILKRVDNRFPQAPEVRAAYAVFLWTNNSTDTTAARQKFLEIPDRARLKYADKDYLNNTINWPPAMVKTIGEITKAVGDS